MATSTEGVTVSFKTDQGETEPVPLADLEKAADELFDPQPYQTPVPTLHGHRPDTIRLAFGGGLEIDLKDGQLVDYLKTLRLGQELELHVTATVAKVNWSHRTTSDDGDEKVTHVVGVNVHSIELPEAT